MKENDFFRDGVLVFTTVLCIFLLTFTGVSSTDDEQLYAALTASLAERGAYTALPLFGNDRIQGNSSGVEPLHSIIGVPFYLLAKALNLGTAQLLHLLPSIYTAFTASIISEISARRGYSRKTSFLAGLSYAVCTIAFPFGRTYFREPLAALLVATALLFLERIYDQRSGWKKQLLFLSCMLVPLILSGVVKVTLFFSIPVFLLGALRALEEKTEKSPLLLLVSVVIVMVISFGGFVLLDFLLPSAGLRRLSVNFLNYLVRTVPNLPHDYFWRAVAGMLLSPGKGLFVYSPILLLVFCKSSARKNSADLLIASGLIAGLAAIQALAYDKYWWTITWSVRSLLPALPALMILCLPLLDQTLNSQKKGVRLFLAGLILFSFLIQIGRILVSDPVYARWAVETLGNELSSGTQWKLSMRALWRHWWLFFDHVEIDIAWFRLINPDYILLTACLIMAISIPVFCVILILKKRAVNNTMSKLMIAICTFLLPLSSCAAKKDSRYFGYIEPYHYANRFICNHLNRNDLLLVNAYLKPSWWYFFNFGCGKFQWIGLPYEHPDAFSGELFYPHIDKLSLILNDAFSNGREVYLFEHIYPNIPHYHETLRKLGVESSRLVEFSNPPSCILHLSKTN